jgi:Peptidase family S41
MHKRSCAAAQDAHRKGLTAADSLVPCLSQSEVAATLRGFERERVDEVELDLRGNLGGLVSQGVETARLFVEGESPHVLRHSKVCDICDLSHTALAAQPGHPSGCCARVATQSWRHLTSARLWTTPQYDSDTSRSA